MENQENIYQEAMNQGHSAAWDQKWEIAAEHYKRAIEAIPSRVQAINNLGLAYFQLQRYKDAEACYKQAAKLAPQDPLAVERLAQIFERTGQIKQAAEFSMQAAELYLKIKDVDKAIENWARVTMLIPEHLKAHSRLAVVHERLGHKGQAVEEYISVAALLQDVGEVSRAVQTVEKALQIAPDNEKALDALELVRSNKTLPKPQRVSGATGALRMAAVLEMEEEDEQQDDLTDVDKKGPDPVAEARQAALTELAGLLFEFSMDDFGDPEQTLSGLKSMFGRSREGDLEAITKHLGAAIDLQTRQEHNDAVRELKKAIDQGLDIPAANFNIGLLYHNLNNT
ncbi:MAG: tetratricopeptide repeat protein, partial [Anaerolineales bacterium]